MADDNSIKVTFEAKIGDLQTASQAAADAVKGACGKMVSATQDMKNQITSHFQSLTATLGSIGNAFMGLAAIFAGGAIFHKTIKDTVDFATETRRLNAYLAEGHQKAGAWILAGRQVGLSAEKMTMMFMALGKAVNKNEEAFDALGVKTKDSNGQLRPMGEILLDTVAKIKELKAGTDQAAAAQETLGRGGRDLFSVLKLNAPAIQDMQMRMRDLGIDMDEVVSKSVAYKRGMADMELVMLSLKLKIAGEAMPALTDLSRWFSSTGPAAIGMFGSVFKGLAAIFDGFAALLTEIITRMGWWFEGIKTELVTFAKMANAALHLDWAGIQSAYEAGVSGLATLNSYYANAIELQWKQTTNRIQALFSNISKATSAPPAAEGKSWESPGKGGAGKGGGKEFMQEAQRQWEEMQMAENKFLEESKVKEREYWQSILATTKEGSEEQTAVKHKVYQLSKQIARDEYQEHMAQLQLEYADEMKNSQRRIEIKNEMFAYTKKKYGEESHYTTDAQRKVVEEERRAAMERKRINMELHDHEKTLANMDVEIARGALQHRHDMGLMTERQYYQQLQALRTQDWINEKAAEQKKLQEANLTELEKVKLLQQLAVAQKKYMADMQNINHQATAAMMRDWMALGQNILRGMGNAINGVLWRTQKFKDAMLQLFQMLTGEIINILLKMIAQKIIIAMMGVTAQATMALKQISIDANVAAANAMAFYPPPVAPAFAQMAYAQTMIWAAKIPAAKGGWEVPKDTLAMLHKDEMVLPSALSDKIRGMTEGGPGRGATINNHIHVPIHVDGRLTQSEWNAEIGKVAKALQRKMGSLGLAFGAY